MMLHDLMIGRFTALFAPGGQPTTNVGKEYLDPFRAAQAALRSLRVGAPKSSDVLGSQLPRQLNGIGCFKEIVQRRKAYALTVYQGVPFMSISERQCQIDFGVGMLRD